MSDQQDYFSLFGLARSFDIDLPDLEKRYFAAQRKFHPDRIVGKSASERVAAISESMNVNAAYETLKSPLKRAQYMLSLHGIALDKIKPSQELIMEVMELRERLSETEALAELDIMNTQIIKSRDTDLLQLAQAFSASNNSFASELVIRLSYFNKILEEVRVKIKALQKDI